MPDAPQTVTLAIKMLDEAMEIPSYPISAFDSFYEAIDRMRKIRDVLDAGGAAERGEPVAWVVMDKDGKRYAVDFSREEAERVCEAVNRYKSPVYSLNDPFYGPFTVRPLIFGDAARRASTAPQEGGEKP